MTIRSAAEGDFAGTCQLAKQLAATFPFDERAFALSYPAVLQNPAATLLVAVEDSSVIGYLLGYTHVTFWAGADIWWVEELIVEKQSRNQGVGRALMHHFEERARAGGGRIVCLCTRRAADFYRAIGYEESALYFRRLL